MDNALVFVGGGLSWIIAIGQLAKPLNRNNRILFCFFFCIGYWQTYFGLLFSTNILEFPHLHLTHIPFLFFSAPLSYYYFKVLYKKQSKFRAGEILHFVPGLLCILLLIPFFGQDKITKLDAIVVNLNNGDLGQYTYLAFVASVLILAYLSYLLYRYTNFKWQSKNELSFYLSWLLVFWFIAAIIGIIALYYKSLDTARYTSLLVSISIFILYILGQIFPQILQQFYISPDATKKHRYEKSRLKNINIVKLERNLGELMDTNKLYRNENLTLHSFADSLGVTSHQLSEYLNDNLKQNLNSYLNFYRVQEARELLLEFLDKTSLEIGLMVGFNSNSSFHSAFKKETGKSPLQYRKSAQRKNKFLSKK